MTESKRRFTDEEFAVILRTASQLQEERPASAVRGPDEGLSLDEIQAIAREVGLDPDRVAQAAAMLGSQSPGEVAGRFGGPVKYQFEGTIPGELDESDLNRLVETIRRVTNHQGKVQHVLNSLEWASVGEPSQMYVNLSPRDGETAIRVSVDRSAVAALGTIFPLVGWGIATGIFGAITEPGTALGVATLIAGTATGTVATMAAIWKATGRAVADKATNLFSMLSHDGHALLPPGSEPPEES